MWHFVVEIVLQVLIYNKICKFLSARVGGWAGCVCADSKEGVPFFSSHPLPPPLLTACDRTSSELTRACS